jgi:CRISPR/Cas system CSM-associated protein Csm2 small subunit
VFRERAVGAGGPPPRSSLPADYLAGGYFDADGHPQPELVEHVALEVARAFDQAGLTNKQLRRLFAKVRTIEGRLATGAAFAELRSDVATLRPNAASAVQRGMAPPILFEFIEANVPLAKENERAFLKGFVRHFTAVTEWFTYVHRGE